MVITSNDLNSLETQVNNFIDEGWQAQGGISISLNFQQCDGCFPYVYAQAIINSKRFQKYHVDNSHW